VIILDATTTVFAVVYRAMVNIVVITSQSSWNLTVSVDRLHHVMIAFHSVNALIHLTLIKQSIVIIIVIVIGLVEMLYLVLSEEFLDLLLSFQVL
jgi:hypothetical protein